MGLFRKGKTCIIAKIHGTDLFAISHSTEGKPLSYSQINMVNKCDTIITVKPFQTLFVSETVLIHPMFSRDSLILTFFSFRILVVFANAKVTSLYIITNIYIKQNIK